ncbi:MAG: hypothetical protein JWO19_6104, partial [Bryobacterales bacterium]|nr:hypothetical protein [Bryobacterales bacterium]
GLGFLINVSGTERLQIFAAPLIGIMVVPFGANTLYSILGIEYSHAALMSAASCVALTLLRFRGPFSGLLPNAPSIYSGIFAALMAAFAVLINDAATLHAHGSAIFYYDGSDHGGYAHLADWLGAYTTKHLPTDSPERPYESWPALLFAFDPRFGSFGLLEIIAQLHRTSAIFSYDLACAAILSAGSLGVAAMFARTPPVFALLTLGLFGSHWYDYAHSGYFAKIIAYPAALLVAGLASKVMPRVTVGSVVALASIAAAMGTMHSGVGSAFLMIPILGTSIAAIAISRDHRIQLSNAILLCGVVTASPIIAAGLSARPLAVAGYPDYSLSWMYVWPRLLDLENQGVAVSGISSSWLVVHFGLALTIWALLLGIAISVRSVVAMGLLGGPAVMLLVLSITGATALAFQLIGYFYPAVLCGACVLLADVPRRTLPVLALVVLMIGQRLPRFAGAVDRYALHQNQRYVFTAAETDRIAGHIGAQAVEIDVPDVLPAIFLLVELGRRKLNLQYSDQTWNTLFRYRGWTPSVQKTRAELVLRQTDPMTADHFKIESRHQ